MAKIHGKLTRVYINGYDLSNFFNSEESAHPVDTAEVSSFGDDLKSYVTGLRTGNIRLGGFWSGGAGEVDEVLNAAIGQDGTLAPIINIVRAADIGAMGDGGFADLESGYNLSSPIGGAVAISADFQASQGLLYHRTVLPKGTLGVSTSPGGTTPVYNGGTASVYGGTAFMQVFGGISGTPVFSIQESANGSTGWVTKASFPGVTAIGAYALAIAGTIQPFLRASVAGGTALAWIGIHQPRG